MRFQQLFGLFAMVCALNNPVHIGVYTVLFCRWQARYVPGTPDTKSQKIGQKVGTFAMIQQASVAEVGVSGKIFVKNQQSCFV